MSSAPDTTTSGATGTAAPTRPVTPGLSDGLGDRLVTFDSATQSSIEMLRFKREFSDAPGFEEAVQDRLEELGRFQHPSIAAVRRLEALDDGLALVSTATPGRRLSEMVHVARGAPFAIDLIQQLAPALAALHQQGPRIAHGLLTAERIIITREGRLIVVEHVLASGFELLRLPATRLRTEFGIAVPANTDPVGLNQRSDIVQLGFLALSLLLGRRLDPAHYPASIPTLLDEFSQADASAAARLRPWLERALQQGDKPFTSAQEAQVAFGALAPEPAAPAPAPAADPATGPQAKADIPKLEVRPDATEPKIDLRAEAPADAAAPTMEHDVPAAPSVAAAAPPRRSSAAMTAVTWVGAVLVLTGITVGGLYVAGLFSDRASHTTTDVTVSKPATSAAEPAAAPAGSLPDVPPTAVPAPGTSDAASAPAAGREGGAPGSTPPASGAATASPAQGRPAPATAADAFPAAGARADAAAPARPAFAGGGVGGVKVSAPFDLQVFENGTLVGSNAGSIAVVDGSHTFDLVNDSLGFRLRSTVNVHAGQLSTLSVPAPNGRLSINAVPWADVYIDGTLAGQTPLANVLVPIGKHVITFKHPQLGEQQQTVIVRADGLTRVSATFQQ